MNRKGFAVMFDWIFSLVAGVLIFSFLIYFAVQHTDLFGKITSKVVAEELDVLFSQYETTETKSVLDFGKEVELEFSCDDQRQRFKINNRDGKSVWGKIIFGPEKIESQKINVATMSWDVPFRVANFVYLWDKSYTIDGNIPDIDFLDNFRRENEGDITFEEDNDFPCQNNKKIIYYKEIDGFYEGYVCFKDNDKSEFFGEAMMLGAVFFDNKEDFECVKNITTDRLKIVNKLYYEKANDLIDLNGECDVRGDYSRTNGKTSRDLTNNPFDSNAISQIEDANENLIRGGCASVY